MGEAKRREAALDAGTPWPRRRICPVKKCRSPRVVDLPADSRECREYARFWENENVIALRVCKDCRAIWEPWPDDAPEDCVERAHTHGPCSNCAYRAGSFEMRDPEQREKMLTTAHAAAEFGVDGQDWTLSMPTQFCCHKGIPVKVGKDGLEFDYEAAGIDPRQQSCTGFLLAMWAAQKNLRRTE